MTASDSVSDAGRARPFQQVDVFAGDTLRGNPVAVVHAAEGVSAEQMLAFTRWTNLSEATFILPPTPQGRAAGADYRVRIFYPAGELPFAGHPTLGSCWSWLDRGGQPQRPGVVVQECGVGLVRVRQGETQRGEAPLSFAAPPLRRSGPLAEGEVQTLCRALDVQRDEVRAAAWCDNGPPWRALLLRDAERVLSVQPDGAALMAAGMCEVGLVGPHPAGAECAFEVRAFFRGAASGLAEDPVTGSLNAALAQWLIAAGLAPSRYVAAQGTALGRAGRVWVQQEGDTVWIGGQVNGHITGQVVL